MKRYVRIMLGQNSVYADECLRGNFIGADFDIDTDLTNNLPENWREFNQKFIPIWLEKNPTKSKISAGLSCGALWTISKGIKIDDIVLCPNGRSSYYVGRILDNYSFHSGCTLPHRRTVEWYPNTIERSSMSFALQKSTGSMGTTSDISSYEDELKFLIDGEKHRPYIVSSNTNFEDPAVFVLEKHLEDFLVANWKHTELGKEYDIFEDDGRLIGQQYQSDTGPIDILAVSKDKSSILVVELKKGRASDNVVGQIQRYMGYVKEELAEANQKVMGAIIALEDDLRIRRALSVTSNIHFYRYEINFKLVKN